MIINKIVKNRDDQLPGTYAIVVPGMNHHANDEEGPDDVQQLQRNQQPVEDVVGGEHRHQAERHIARVVDDTVRQHDQARQHPAQREDVEGDVGRLLLLQVGKHLGSLMGQ